MDSLYADTRPPSDHPVPPPITRRLHTPAGLKYASYGLLLFLIMALLGFIAFMPLAGVADPTTLDPSALAVVVGLGCIVLVIFLVAIIFFLLALYELYVGKMEFGPKHASRVSAGLILVILWIVLLALSFFVSMFAALSAIEPGVDPSEIEMDAAEFRNMTITASLLSIAYTIAISLATVLFVLELIGAQKKALLWGGFGLRIAASVIAIVILMVVLPTSGTINLNETDMQTGYSNATSIIDLIGLALFFVAYRAARERILTGKILPVGTQQVPPPPPRGPQPQWGEPAPPSEAPPEWEEVSPPGVE